MNPCFRFLAVLLLAVPVHAGTIASQSPSASGGGWLSARYGVDGSGFDEFVWDSFSSTTNQIVREIQWQGTRTGSVPASFEISINTSAFPGGTTWQVTGSADETPTGTPGVYNYRFTLPAGFAMTAGQTYWLQVFAVQNEMPNWQWSAGTGGNGTHFAQVPAITGNYRYINTTGDVAFSVLNAATVPVSVTLERSPSLGGSVTGGGTFAPGANVTVTATPASGRTFLNWTEAGVIVSTNATYSFAADGNKALTANFSGPNTGPYVINAVANPAVNGNVGGAGTYNAGEIVDLDISAADGVSFVGWTENGILVNLPYVGGGLFQFPSTEDRNLVANFSYPYNSFFINGVVSPASSGTVVLGGTAGLAGKSYNGGTPITLTATPANGYRFVHWRQGAGLGDLNGPPNIVSTNPVLNHLVCYGTTLTAVFEPAFPLLSLSTFPVAGGTTTGGGTFANGTNVTANASPAVGYAFESWRMGTMVVSTDANYTFALTTHTALKAIFVATNRTITANSMPTEGGSVTGGGVVGNGATVTLTATPATGFAFESWILDGAPAGSNNPATFEALNDHAFVANFTSVPVFVVSTNAAPAAGGTTEGDGAFNSGTVVFVTAMPNEGFYFVNWTEDGIPVGTTTTLDITANANRTLLANFAPGFTVTTEASYAPGGTIAGGGGYGTGGNVTVVATPAAGYQFANWTEGGAVVSVSSSYSFPAAADRTLVANFLPILGIDGGTSGSLAMTWPASATDWILQESPDLNPASWVDSELSITTDGAQNQISIPSPAGRLFFRLIRP